MSPLRGESNDTGEKQKMSEQKNDNKTQNIRFGIGNKQIIANNTYDNCVVFCVEGKDYKTNKLTEKQIDELFDKGLLKRFCEEIAGKVVDKLTSNEELACLLKDAVNDAIKNEGKSLRKSLDDYAKNVIDRLDDIKDKLKGLQETTEKGIKGIHSAIEKLTNEVKNASARQSMGASATAKQFQNALAKKLTKKRGIKIAEAKRVGFGKYKITISGEEKVIPAHKFENIKGIAQVIIEDGVTSVDSSAFYNCTDLTSITIPDSVTSIGSSAFSGCSGLTDVYYQGDLSGWSEIDFADSSANPMYYADNLYINGELLQGEIVIPEGTETIGDYAFYLCSGLTSITIPDSVIDIGECAFRWCSGLTSITIPGSVTSIGSSAFEDCSGLTSIIIPDSVIDIGSRAFSGCRSLTSIIIPDSVTRVGNYAFSECSGLTSITIPDSVTSIGSSAFQWCTGLTSITIPDSVTSIGDWAFSGCRSLTSIIIPDSVIDIGSRAFSGCTGLTSIVVEDGNTVYHSAGNCLIETATKTLIAGCKTSVIPDDGSVTSIEEEAFYDCDGLTNITIPDSVTSIGEKAFHWCKGLTSITIPDSVIDIGWRAFYGCTGLTSITIPDSVISIGDWAFYYCSGLTSVTIGNGVTSIGENAFCDCSSLTTINFQGKKAQWQAIKKDSWWDDDTGDYTVHCTDGKLRKER